VRARVRPWRPVLCRNPCNLHLAAALAFRLSGEVGHRGHHFRQQSELLLVVEDRHRTSENVHFGEVQPILGAPVEDTHDYASAMSGNARP
jgi:hypothetical protein